MSFGSKFQLQLSLKDVLIEKVLQNSREHVGKKLIETKKLFFFSLCFFPYLIS